MNAPQKYFITDVAEDISTRRLTFKTNSNISLHWQFTQSGIPVNLTSCSAVYFIYSDDNSSTTITGSVYNAINGEIIIPITPSKIPINGEFDWGIALISGINVNTCTAYGRLILIGNVDQINQSSSSNSSSSSSSI